MNSGQTDRGLAFARIAMEEIRMEEKKEDRALLPVHIADRKEFLSKPWFVIQEHLRQLELQLQLQHQLQHQRQRQLQIQMQTQMQLQL